MTKNGLFLISIGLLIILLFALDRQTMQYDLLSMTTGLFLVAAGGYIFYRGNKKEKAEKARSEVKK